LTRKVCSKENARKKKGVFSMSARYFGVTKNLDLDPSLIKPDVRPFRYKFNEFVVEYGEGILFLFVMFLFAFPIVNAVMFESSMHNWTEPTVILAVLWFWITKGRHREFMFRKPIEEDAGDDWGEDDGLFYLGNDSTDFSSIWFGKADMSVHLLVFGSTGSGKSRFLLGLLYQAMLVGTSVMYVDGKGDNTVFWLVYSFCRRVGREDDLLVINYLTGGDTIEQKSPFNHRLSNTNNPMSYGTADNLNSLIVGLMRDAGGDGAMWKGRARTMLKGLLNALCYKRDNEGLNLDIMEIRNFFPLDKIYNLSRDPNLEDSARDPIRKYLLELPGFSEEQAAVGDIPGKAIEQHNFLTMQLTEVMSDLSETYGHIFGVPLGEVDFKDVVFNRRILFVLLPALEKDPDALEGLGKLVVAGVRSALAPSLGNKVEGTKREVIDTKPTNSKTPFLLILDEYGYYSVPGFAVVAAQARSLGVSVVFAGQDYPSFQKASKEEAASTLANTNIKICMKLEDPEDTFKVIEARGGDSEVANSSGQEHKGSSFLGYSDQKQTRIEVRKRINLRDLVRQGPGEAHVIFGDTISRCRFFYYDPFMAFEAKLNQFLMIDRPKDVLVKKILGATKKLTNLLEGKEKIKNLGKISDNGLKGLFADMAVAEMFNESLEDAAIHAIGMIETRNSLKDIELKNQVELSEGLSLGKSSPETVDEEESDTEEDSVMGENLAAKIAKELQEIRNISAEEKSPEPNAKADSSESSFDDSSSEEIDSFLDSFDNIDQDEILKILETDDNETDDMEQEAGFVADEFESLLKDAVKSNLSNKVEYNAETMSPENQLGHDKKEDSKKAIELLGKGTIYPNKPLPNKIEKGELEDTLASILDQIEKDKQDIV
jgi:intracellular multiplication protein IcmO